MLTCHICIGKESDQIHHECWEIIFKHYPKRNAPKNFLLSIIPEVRCPTNWPIEETKPILMLGPPSRCYENKSSKRRTRRFNLQISRKQLWEAVEHWAGRGGGIEGMTSRGQSCEGGVVYLAMKDCKMKDNNQTACKWNQLVPHVQEYTELQLGVQWVIFSKMTNLEKLGETSVELCDLRSRSWRLNVVILGHFAFRCCGISFW